jgi:hypothetical protein
MNAKVPVFENRYFSKAIGAFCCSAESLCYGDRLNNNS